MKLTAGRITAVGGIAAVATIGLLTTGADAHHPEVSATSVCADGQAQVRIVAASWESDIADHRYNPSVSVSFDGTVVGTGAFLPGNGFTFTVPYATTPDGATHTVRATAVAPFGPVGEYGSAGEFREATVTLPQNCVATTTTTAPVTTTTAPVTTTTAAVGGGTVTTSSVPTVVGGVVETRPDVAAPIAVQPRFAG